MFFFKLFAVLSTFGFNNNGMFLSKKKKEGKVKKEKEKKIYKRKYWFHVLIK